MCTPLPAAYRPSVHTAASVERCKLDKIAMLTRRRLLSGSASSRLVEQGASCCPQRFPSLVEVLGPLQALAQAPGVLSL